MQSSEEDSEYVAALIELWKKNQESQKSIKELIERGKRIYEDAFGRPYKKESSCSK